MFPGGQFHCTWTPALQADSKPESVISFQPPGHKKAASLSMKDFSLWIAVCQFSYLLPTAAATCSICCQNKAPHSSLWKRFSTSSSLKMRLKRMEYHQVAIKSWQPNDTYITFPLWSCPATENEWMFWQFGSGFDFIFMSAQKDRSLWQSPATVLISSYFNN